MDKRIAGKWHKSDWGATLNIFDEEPLRMKLSFSTSGYYNFEPNCVYEKDGWFCFEINDELQRQVYFLKYEDNFLKGHYTTRQEKETPVEFGRLSETPEDGPFAYKPAQATVPNTEMTRIDILKKYAAYDAECPSAPCRIEYKLFEPAPEILKKYDYDKYTGSGAPSGDATACDATACDAAAFSLLDFVCDHFGHDGSGGLPPGRRAEDIITFCEKHNGKTNCRGLAILLASLLRMNGIKASHITCMPYEEPFEDCHVVADCYLPSGARIMLDPTNRLYLKDAEGGYVPLQKLRKMLIDGETFYPNSAASYNGGGFNANDYRQYMTKNTFRFARGTFCADGHDDRSVRRIELIPAGYPTEKFGGQNKKEFVYNESEFWG